MIFAVQKSSWSSKSGCASFSKIIDLVSKELAKWRSKSIKIDLKINVENYLKFSSKNVVGANEAWVERLTPYLRMGSPSTAMFNSVFGRKKIRTKIFWQNKFEANNFLVELFSIEHFLPNFFRRNSFGRIFFNRKHSAEQNSATNFLAKQNLPFLVKTFLTEKKDWG